MNFVDKISVKVKLILPVFIFLFFFLLVSEYYIAFYNVKYDLTNVTNLFRFLSIFKPLVMVLAFVFAVIISAVIIKYLNPFFNYLDNGNGYNKARIASIKVPWFCINFQIVMWSIATVAYYAMKSWNAPGGTPFLSVLLSKASCGLISGLYVSFIINLILKESKQKLKITEIKEGENDNFSRYKDLIAVVSAAVFLTSHFLHLAYYFAFSPREYSSTEFLVKVIPFSILLIVIAVVPVFLSKREYKYQIDSLKSKLKSLSGDQTTDSEMIYLINFDELGELSHYVNHVLRRFRTMLEEIKAAVSKLSLSSESLTNVSQHSSAASNQQAAAVSEIVSTMEDSDRLSKTIGDKAGEVLERSVNMTDLIREGSSTIKEYLQTSESVKEANSSTIEFVQTLNDDIKAIWEVVTIINGIAEQVKIIAFNAELEASAAGEAGKNFEIVASEIRRLADNTVSSTAEIRNKITLIEKSAKGLLTASHDATNLIEEGWEISKKSDLIFDNIQDSSASAKESAESIEKNIRMQIQGFEQILNAMKQISEGASGFTESTAISQETALDLQKLVATLKNIVLSE